MITLDTRLDARHRLRARDGRAVAPAGSPGAHRGEAGAVQRRRPSPTCASRDRERSHRALHRARRRLRRPPAVLSGGGDRRAGARGRPAARRRRGRRGIGHRDPDRAAARPTATPSTPWSPTRRWRRKRPHGWAGTRASTPSPAAPRPRPARRVLRRRHRGPGVPLVRHRRRAARVPAHPPARGPRGAGLEHPPHRRHAVPAGVRGARCSASRSTTRRSAPAGPTRRRSPASSRRRLRGPRRWSTARPSGSRACGAAAVQLVRAPRRPSAATSR